MLLGTPTRRVAVTNYDGLHIRRCRAIAEAVRKYRARVTVRRDSVSADGASVWELLWLAAGPGTELDLSATGEEAEEALDAVERVFRGDAEVLAGPPHAGRLTGEFGPRGSEASHPTDSPRARWLPIASTTGQSAVAGLLGLP